MLRAAMTSAAPAECRRVATQAAFGSLATLARDPVGWPFATLVAVAFDRLGRPLLLLSRLAEHTKNLQTSPRASLLVAQTAPGRASAADASAPNATADPLAAGRMTILGTGALVDTGEASDARARFLEVHPEAAPYATFADFAMWRIDVTHVRWVGGFGRMEWVSGEDYRNEFARSGDPQA
jgi:putative heme iron utilization protein